MKPKTAKDKKDKEDTSSSVYTPDPPQIMHPNSQQELEQKKAADGKTPPGKSTGKHQERKGKR
ncbi:MAG TPA: hypothetical protein VIN08_03405 [Ohtaekwangia sp.]|uniref:hypothetical protein n=1 Tax=Ohtaekwangia sp. TaxID=2066019 RepID=UPI002F949060